MIVEVTVPPNSRATEKDLRYMVSESLPHTFKLRRPIHADARDAVIRIKGFASFWPAFLRLEKGIKTNFHRKKDTTDVNHGL